MEALVSYTLLERGFLEQLVSALTRPMEAGGSPQIVLAGPPGTSKTWVAEAIARHITGDANRVRLVQFHPNYSYEAFVEGLRPVAEGGGITFKQQHGALLRLVEDMRAAGEANAVSPLYALVVDEMNRANLPRVFGELMYLFEYRDKTIRLQYSEAFSLPANLRFIGTMNTADRSIRSIDIALRRRFDVFELKPDSGVLSRYFQKYPLNVSNLIEGFERLNQKLEGDLDRHHTIGHAFFMKPGLDRTTLRAIWDRKIYPLIEEYFFDQLDIAKTEYVFEKFWPE
jgi:5-methylcytosine-specific restriction endonuclease McrBC GTP-binding regulatory subunit McrB